MSPRQRTHLKIRRYRCQNQWCRFVSGTTLRPSSHPFPLAWAGRRRGRGCSPGGTRRRRGLGRPEPRHTCSHTHFGNGYGNHASRFESDLIVIVFFRQNFKNSPLLLSCSAFFGCAFFTSQKWDPIR